MKKKMFLVLFLAGVMSAGAFDSIQAEDTNSVLDLLIKKNLITQKEAESVKEKPSIKLNGFVQTHYIIDRTHRVADEFKLRRARLGVGGNIMKEISYNLVFGGVENPDSDAHLVDAYADIDFFEYALIRAGQFKVPFGLEGPESSSELPAIEQSTVFSRMNPLANFRDIGVQASGAYEKFSYKASITNGTGANNSEDNDTKDFVGRVGFNPSQEVGFGVSVHSGKYVLLTRDDMDRKRTGVDFRYKDQSKMVRVEYLLRKDELASGSELKRRGGYILGTYRFKPKIEGVLRYEVYDPNTDVDDDRLKTTTVGMSYYFVGYTRVAINYDFRDDDSNPDLDDLLTAQLQIVF